MANVKNKNYFNVFEHINSNLEEEEISGQVIISLNEDCVKEPYIEVIYIDEDGDKAGFVNDYDNLSYIDSFACDFKDVFDVSNNDSVLSIVYDTDTYQLNLIRMRGKNYLGNKFSNNYGSAIFAGYIINKKLNLEYKEKLTILYEVMKEIMENCYEEDFESIFIFKVKEEIIENILVTRNWKDGFIENEDEQVENSDKYNLSIIEKEFGVNFSERQKVKKL